MTELAAAIKDIPMPPRMKYLPISDKGFPIPAFVAWLDPTGTEYVTPGTAGAKRDFRVINQEYMDRCYRNSLCWICGGRMTTHRIFAIGPMCALSGTTMEPPSHRSCAEYAAMACPFLSTSKMRRNDKGLPTDLNAPGIMIERNPGATCLYEATKWERFDAGNGGKLTKLGPPVSMEWWSSGRLATRAEVLESIDSGLPILMKIAEEDGPESMQELTARRHWVEQYLPKE